MTCPKADEALITAYARGETDLVPGWLVEPDEARRLGVSLLEYWWMQDHGYSDRLQQFRSAWRIEAQHAGQRRQRTTREAELRRKYSGGGPTDPLDSCAWKGEAA